MLGARQGLSEVIGDVSIACNVLDPELPLLDPILQPVEAHVNALRQARNHGLVGKANSALIIAEEQSRGLRVAQVVQDASLVVGDACSGEQAGVLGLLDRRAHNWDDVGVARNRAVYEGERVEGEAGDKSTSETEAVIGARDGSCSGPRQVGGVGEDEEQHVRGTEDARAMTVDGDVA